MTAAKKRVKVTALRPEGRWRVGRHFTTTPTTLAVLEHELALLEHDELLMVETIEDKPAPKPRKTSAKKPTSA